MSRSKMAAPIVMSAALLLFAPRAGLAQTAAVDHPPAEAFGTLPQIRSPSLSPDGKHLATIQVYRGRPSAVIRTLDPAGVTPVIIPYDKGYIVDVKWASNTRLLVTVNLNAQTWGDSQINPWYRTAAVDADGGNMVSMFSDQRDAKSINYSASGILDLDLDDPDSIYMPLAASENPSRAEFSVGMTDVRYSAFKVDLNNGRSHREFLGAPDTVGWLMDGHGIPSPALTSLPSR